ncbi:MAG: hypothetical protein MUC68_09475, partial [Burkholderiaceae bacterium]|nr:hypothetical protein [Burkholderiaceae bacterium]
MARAPARCADATDAREDAGRGSERVAVVAIHGVADQRPGQTVRELAQLLGHGGDGAPRYVEGRTQGLLVPVPPLRPGSRTAGTPGLPTPDTPTPDTPAPGPREHADAAATPRLPNPAAPSRFHAARLRTQQAPRAALEPDLGLAYTDYLLQRYAPAEHETLYESTQISLLRRADGTAVDLVELYWADCSRLRPGGVRALSAMYQLFFHLTTLARDLVDHAALATGHARGFVVLQRLFATTTWLLKLPAALLQLAMLLMLLFGAAALVPQAQMHQLLPAAAIALAAASLGAAALAWVRRDGAADVSATDAAMPDGGVAQGRDGPAARHLAGTVTAIAAALGFLLVAAAAQWLPAWFDRLYFATCALLVGALGVLLVERYRRLVRDARAIGVPLMLIVVVALFVAHPEAWAGRLPLTERMVLAALRTGELLLAAMLAVWALLVVLQSLAILLSYRVGGFGSVGGLGDVSDTALRDSVARTLATARLGTVASTALFAMLSLLLWSVLVALVDVALDRGLSYDPILFGEGYRGAALFLQARLREVGGLFVPLLGLAMLLGVLALYALAPSLREEIAPRAPSTAAADARASQRLGAWWDWGRRAIIGRIALAVPLLAIVGALAYLVFLAGWPDLGDDGERGTALLSIGQWLAGGAVTLTALGARFTQTFGKLRVALDAILDIDNYLRDPADGRSPRAAIFSRAAALLAHLRSRGYTRIVLVAHSQGTVICTDLLHWLAQRGRLDECVGSDTPLALVTVGSPLRDLYAQRFPLLYGWMGSAPVQSGAPHTAPDPARLGLAAWTNAYRSGDYVGRAIWRADSDPARYTPALHMSQASDPSRSAADGTVAQAGRRTEFCLGSGAHTHYFSRDAVALADEIDRLIAEPIA